MGEEPMEYTDFLPVSKADMEARDWKQLDILLVSGDAYIDHPAFGVSLLGRLLEANGYRVGIVAQPRWDALEDIARLGRPGLFCGISAGSLDSMLAHYTAFRKKRHDDAYTPGGKAGSRPNRASIVYTNLVRQAFPGLPIVLGGIEASLRRAAHYDFWTNRVRRSILFDAKADFVVYGMAERAILELAQRLQEGRSAVGIKGTVISQARVPDSAIVLPSFEEIQDTPRLLLDATLAMETQIQQANEVLAQVHGKRVAVFFPPASPLDTEELDRLHDLPYTRRAHPAYSKPIPALDMIRCSVTAVRGCGGGCTFCSLALHQGRRLRSRSKESILREVTLLTKQPDWRGSLTDIGGPTANLWGAECRADPGKCGKKSCLFPSRCPHLMLAQDEYLDLLRSAQQLDGVKHVRVGSGIRYDIALEDPDFCRGIVAEFTGGQLKLAPEHSVDHVLQLMRKTDFSLFSRFLQLFTSINRQSGKQQYIVPYIMTAFPGCRYEDTRALADWFRRQGWKPQQIQCFIPTPGTVASAMYHAECEADGKPIYVAKTDRERVDQHALLIPGQKPR